MRITPVAVSVLALAVFVPPASAASAVGLPDTVAGPAGSDVVVRVTADTGGADLASLDLAFSYDDTLLELRGAYTTALTHGFALLDNVIGNPTGPDTLDLSLYTGSPVPAAAGPHDVVWVVFRVRSDPGTSPLLWSPPETWVNDTIPDVLADGSVAAAAASVGFIAPDDANGAPAGPASSVWVPVVVDPVDGLHAFDVELQFDPSVIVATDVATADATAAFTLTSNLSTPGTVDISLFDAYPVPASGRQVVARVLFQVVGAIGEQTPIDLTVGVTDDGYTTYLDDGLFTVCADADRDGVTACGGDCDDADPSIHPGADDSSCDGVDEDCDGVADDHYVPRPTTCGVGACLGAGATSCAGGQESDGCVPGAPTPETCNGIDDDCDGEVDNGVGPVWYRDADGDGHGVPAPTLQACTQPAGYAATSDDCNDVDALAFGFPVEVLDLMLDRGEDLAHLTWVGQSATAGPGTSYDIVTGIAEDLVPDDGFVHATCLASGVPANAFDDTRPNTPAQDILITYYLVRARNSCGLGTYGSGTQVPDPRDGLDASGPCP